MGQRFALPQVAVAEPPPGLSAPEREKWKKQAEKETRNLNSALISNSKEIARFDPKAGRLRFFFVLGMAGASLLGTLAFLWAITRGEDLGTTITGGAVAIGILLVAGFVNPIQTVERDILFRRWSDIIAHTFLLQAADPGLQPSKLTGPANDANARFSALATAYAAVANKTLETLQVITKPAEEAEEQEEDATKSISVTNPGEQTNEKGKALSLQITATGGETLAYSQEGLPSGLELDSESGKVSGRPDAAGKNTVTITVKDETGRLEGKATFEWTITDA